MNYHSRPLFTIFFRSQLFNRKWQLGTISLIIVFIMAGHIKRSWIRDCVNEIELPGSPWYDVKDLISHYIVDVIRINGFNERQMENMHYFLGTDFVSRYKVSGVGDTVSISKAVRPAANDKDIEEKCKLVLQEALKYAKCNINMDISKTPNCFQNLVNLITNILETNLKNQIDITRQSLFISHEKNSLILALKPYTDKEIELLGEALVNILQKESGRLDNILISLKGRILPMSLRTVVYRLLLIKIFKNSYVDKTKEYTKRSMDEVPSNKFMRELFVEKVKTGVEKHKLTKATSSPIRQLIQNTVLQTFENYSGLKPHAININTQKESCKVLNVYYTANTQFDSFHVLWLIPFQMAIRKDVFAPEHIYEIAMWLDCFSKYVYPMTILSVNSLMMEIWKDILTKTAFHEIIEVLESMSMSCSNDNIKQILQKQTYLYDIENSFRSTSDLSNSSIVSQTHSMNTNHMVLSIRKWIINLFVGITNIPMSIFLFDQMFMESFSNDCISKICQILLLELKSRILVCTSSEEICFTLLEKVSEISVESLYQVWNSYE